jgi:rifampin ADP-ribosylating transferase
MLYDPANPVVQLCVKGIETEYSGDPEKAGDLYRQAWEQATCSIELFTAAHYLARVQQDVGEGLRWNLVALEQAKRIEEQDVAEVYPSLYLNVASSYEKLGDIQRAKEYYSLADTATIALPDDGYGNMIRKGINAGLDRMEK